MSFLMYFRKIFGISHVWLSLWVLFRSSFQILAPFWIHTDYRQRDQCNFALRGSTRVVVDHMDTWIAMRNEKHLEHPIPVQKIYILKSVVAPTGAMAPAGATVDFLFGTLWSGG